MYSYIFSLKGNRDERETVDISLAKQDAQVMTSFNPFHVTIMCLLVLKTAATPTLCVLV